MPLTIGPEHPNSLNMQWRREYRAKRYMATLTVEELNRRGADLITNIVTLTPAGQIGCQDIPDGDGQDWWRKWTHVCDEFQTRFGPYPNGFSRELVTAARTPNATFPEVPPAYTELMAVNLQPGRFLLRFGRAGRMEAMLRTGSIQISPASSYKDPSLNAAVHDDELSFESIAQPGVQVRVSLTPDGPWHPVGGLKEFRHKSTMRTDYFVYCMTHTAAHRLFDDFDYDACLAITEPKEFVERLIAAVKETLPGWGVGGGSVKYADPHFAYANSLAIPMTKHFRYAYQREFRMYWLPPEPRNDLKPFLVELGSLEDCANLIVLPGKAVA
jgi:hypothetical protein